MNWTTITVTAGLALMLGSATDAALAASPPAHCRMTVTDLKGHAKHDKVALARLTTEQLPPVTDAYNAADPVTDFTFDEAYAAKGGKGVAVFLVQKACVVATASMPVEVFSKLLAGGDKT